MMGSDKAKIERFDDLIARNKTRALVANIPSGDFGWNIGSRDQMRRVAVSVMPRLPKVSNADPEVNSTSLLLSPRRPVLNCALNSM